jgi:hypothetical protein
MPPQQGLTRKADVGAIASRKAADGKSSLAIVRKRMIPKSCRLLGQDHAQRFILLADCSQNVHSGMAFDWSLANRGVVAIADTGPSP